MLISELIVKLQAQMKDHGDVVINVRDREGDFSASVMVKYDPIWETVDIDAA